ncbi:MAG: hypothetical protein PF961_20135 [Planctomycetota bacterium]|jgi:hypothetical protein|nr:hypothetical protein [Planctomycetota bacterium]
MIKYAPPLLAVCLIAGCSGRDDVAQTQLQRENQRLTTQLEASRADNRRLTTALTESEHQRAEPRPAAAPQAQPAPRYQPTPQPRQPAAVAAGSYVLVLASVGKGTADAERERFAKVAAAHNRRYGASIGANFGVRTPRKGGLQLIYGVDDGVIGMAKSAAERAQAALHGQYADSYVLDIR